MAVNPSVVGVEVGCGLSTSVGSSTGDSDAVSSGVSCAVDVAMSGEGVPTVVGVTVRVTLDGGVPSAGCVLETDDVVPEGYKREVVLATKGGGERGYCLNLGAYRVLFTEQTIATSFMMPSEGRKRISGLELKYMEDFRV